VRIRSVKPEFWRDEVTGCMPPETALFYLGLAGHADDDGRFEWNPALIRADLDPYDVKWGGTRGIEKQLEQLVSLRRVVMYVVDGRTYGVIPSQKRHQKPNRPTPSRLPPPPDPLPEPSVSPHGVPTAGEGVGEGEGEGGEKDTSQLELPGRPDASPAREVPPVARRKKASNDSVEPLRLRIIAFIRSTGTEYVDTAAVAERTQLRRALDAGATEKGIETAYRAVYARGFWHPRVTDVARVLTSASEQRGRNGGAALPPSTVFSENDSEQFERAAGGAKA
jgi:hypothetical protein